MLLFHVFPSNGKNSKKSGRERVFQLIKRLSLANVHSRAS
jgi:hypothetical protein